MTARPTADREAVSAPRAGSAPAARSAPSQFGLDQAVDLADIAVITADAATGEIRSWSRAAERILGYAAEDVIGRRGDFLIPDGGGEEAAALRRRAVAGESITSVETNLRRADGRDVEVSMAVAPIGNVDGEPQVLALVQDITARRRLERRATQATRLEAIGRLAGAVAHDFNNLLTAIQGFADLLADAVPPEDERRADIEEIQRAARRGSDLTRQLLAFSRRQVLRPATVDLNSVIDGLGPMLRRLMREGVELVLGLDPAAGSVHVDPGQLEQVVVNLALNARDAMPTGGQLLIETAPVHLDEDYVGTHPEASVGRHVMLGVSDQGVGVPPELLDQIFEPFFTTKGAEGTGLGLPTVYGIVRQSGGHISVYSAPGMGTTFRVYLPSASPAEPEETDGPMRTVPTPHARVLVVEDDDAIREFTRRVLERAGCDVTVAPDVTSARALAAGLEIDLLLSDVVLPGASGDVLAAELLRDRPSLRVLFMSGYPEKASLEHGLVGDRSGFLAKPFSSAELLAAIADVLALP